jgi:hypothetical protein
MQQLTAGGADLVGAAKLAGFTEEEARSLVPKFADPANPNAGTRPPPGAAADPNAPPAPGTKPAAKAPSDTPPADAGQGTGGNGNTSGGAGGGA